MNEWIISIIDIKLFNLVIMIIFNYNFKKNITHTHVLIIIKLGNFLKYSITYIHVKKQVLGSF